MASHQKTVYNSPMKLIKTEKGPDGKYIPEVNKEVFEQLKQEKRKLHWIAIAGPARGGKTYLMNRISKKLGGPRFKVGHLSEPETKGLWLAIINHPSLTDHAFALLDTEGVGDTEKGDYQHDTMLFVLTCLLSDTMIYNGLKAIDETSFEKLNFTAEISNYLVTKTKQDLHKVFPELVYVVRDCHLSSVKHGRRITPDELLENALAVKPSDSKTSQKVKTRDSIKKYFPRRKCFTLAIPACRENILLRMDTIGDDQLNEDFIKNAEEVMNYVLSESRASTFGRKLNGRQVAILIGTYVNAYRQHDVPNISSAMENLKALENRRALEEAVSNYKAEMERMKEEKMPTESMADVEREHENVLKSIKQRAHQNAMLEDTELEGFDRNLEEILKKKKDFYIEENKRLSKKKCDDTLKAFYRQIQSKKANEYNRPGGYREYRTDMSNLKKKYKEKTGLGAMKEQMLLEFMEGKREEEDSIFAMDKTLTEKEKEVNEQRQEAEKKARLLEQNRQVMEDMKQNIEAEQRARAQMEEKNEKERARMRKESQEHQRLLFTLMQQRRQENEAGAALNLLGAALTGVFGAVVSLIDDD